ncbi:MAG: hypothetical protein JNM00_04165 [Flavobacteriales bacterium]|nr:hypothetical protein [Flavobacteriales bacterium]
MTASALTEGPIGKKASYLIAARRSYTDALFSPLYQSLFNNIYNANIPEVDAGQVNVFEGEDAPTFGFFDLNAKFSFHLKERDRLTFTLMRSADRLDMRFVQSADALSRQITYNDQSRWGNTGMSVRYNHHWTDSTHTEFQAGGSAFNSELFSEDRVRNLLTGIEEVDLSEEENLLEDYSAKLAHHFYVKQKKALIGLQTNRIGSGHVERDLTDTLEAWLHAAFAEVTTRTRIGSNVTGGMRVYAYSVTSRLYADPRLTISQEVNEYGSIRAAFSVSHQFLQRLQPQNFALNNPDYWQLSDGDDIPVLTAFQLSLGLRWSKNGWTIDGELYGRSTDGVKRGYAHTDSGDSNRFVTGNSSATGFDLLVQRDFGRHHVWLASSTVMSNFSDSTNSVIPESSVHNQELKLIYQVKLDKVEISAAWFFGSGKPYTPLLGTYTQPLINGDQQVLPVFGAINSGLLPVYHRLDISIARHFVTGKTKGSLKLNFFNIYDRQNIRNFQYYAITGEDDEFASGTRAVAMLGFSPSINLSITF